MLSVLDCPATDGSAPWKAGTWAVTQAWSEPRLPPVMSML